MPEIYNKVSGNRWVWYFALCSSITVSLIIHTLYYTGGSISDSAIKSEQNRTEHFVY